MAVIYLTMHRKVQGKRVYEHCVTARLLCAHGQERRY